MGLLQLAYFHTRLKTIILFYVHELQSIQKSRAEELRSQSKSRISNHVSEGPFSPSQSSITSDSEGVMAVVPRISKVFISIEN